MPIDKLQKTYATFELAFDPNSFTGGGTRPRVIPGADSTDESGKLRASIVSGTQAGTVTIVTRIALPGGGNSSYRVPWLFDEEAVEVLSKFIKLKCSLMPYLYEAACQAHERGIPMLRAMHLEFPDDPACDYLDQQYMLGDSLLVAPIFVDDGSVNYYVPAGAGRVY